MSEPRITPEEVVAAYRKHPEIRPRNGSWRADNCGCPAFVLAAANDPQVMAESTGDRQATVASNWCYDRYGAAYIDGFISGVDRPRPTPNNYMRRRLQGFYDGIAAWQAVREQILGEVVT